MVLSFTLDTYCAIAVAKDESDAQHVNRLIELANERQISLARVTTGVKADQTTASPGQASANAEVWSGIDMLEEVAGLLWVSDDPSVPNRDRTEFAFFNSGDTLGGPEDLQLDELIADIVVGRPPEIAGRRMIDVHHLSAHRRSGRDIFVSGNTRDMIKNGKRARLLSEVGIRVMTPAEAVNHALNRVASPAPSS